MNQITLVGNAGKDPELKTVPKKDGSGIWQKLEISLADSRGDEATWYNIEIWGNRAEALQGILKKGMKLTVVGRLEVKSYQSKSGEMRTDLRVNASEIEFVNPKHSQPFGGQQPIVQDTTPQPTTPKPTGEPDIDEEIPF